MVERWGKGRDEISDPSRPQFTLGEVRVYRCARKPCKRAGTKGIAFTANLAIAPTYAPRPCICGREVCANALSHTSFYREIKGIPTRQSRLLDPAGDYYEPVYQIGILLAERCYVITEGAQHFVRAAITTV